ncbi:hypothetical protein [Paenibacillus sp. FSL E2-0178]|uniref:hypothetical protein n=1 Tax=Paenibacillus sp. FSL E2-0178 TaxID=2921361 RepID=UPI0031585F3B
MLELVGAHLCLPAQPTLDEIIATLPLGAGVLENCYLQIRDCCTFCKIFGGLAVVNPHCCTFCKNSDGLAVLSLKLLYFLQDFWQLGSFEPYIVVFSARFQPSRTSPSLQSADFGRYIKHTSALPSLPSGNFG